MLTYENLLYPLLKSIEELFFYREQLFYTACFLKGIGFLTLSNFIIFKNNFSRNIKFVHQADE